MTRLIEWLKRLRSRRAFHYSNDDDQRKRMTWIG
jgi:hypothetical protein